MELCLCFNVKHFCDIAQDLSNKYCHGNQNIYMYISCFNNNNFISLTSHKHVKVILIKQKWRSHSNYTGYDLGKSMYTNLLYVN